jgi:hypothetical protein
MRNVKTQVMAHNTTIRKQDEEYGIQMLRERYRFGNVRLPYLVANQTYFSSPAKVASDHLIREVTTYPQATYTDCLMAQYFLEYNLPNIVHGVATSGRRPRSVRPRFMRERSIV